MSCRELRRLERAERGRGDSLGLTSVEESRAVGPRKQRYFGSEWADFVHAAAVDAFFVDQQPAADNLLLNLINYLGQLHRQVGIFLAEFLKDAVDNWQHSLFPHVFVVGIKGEHHVLLAEAENFLEHLGVQLAGGILELRLADFVQWHKW